MSQRRIGKRDLAAYRRYLRSRERAEETIVKYLSCIEAFCSFLEGKGVTRERAVAWKDALLRGGISPATVNVKLTALNGFFAFAGWKECRVQYLRVQRRLFRDRERELSKCEYMRLLDAARSAGKLRLELLMEAICATGIRVSEVRYLTVEAARVGHTDIALKGKIRTILLPGKLCRKLLRYAESRGIASGEIFTGRSGRPLSRRHIWAEMKGLCARAGVEATKVYPHNLRHLFARTFYRAYRDVARLADILGHSSIETTRIYLISTGAEHARQMNRLKLIS